MNLSRSGQPRRTDGPFPALLLLPAFPTQGSAQHLAGGGRVTGSGAQRAEAISSPWNPLTILSAPADSQNGPPTASPQNSWRITTANAYSVTISTHICSVYERAFISEHVLFPLLQIRKSAQRGQMVCFRSHSKHSHWDSNPGLSDAKSTAPGQVLTVYIGPNRGAADVHGEGGQYVPVLALCWGSALCSPSLTSTMTL